jgi:hypothetical protein
MTTDQKVGGSSPSGRALGTLAPGAVAQMVSGQGFSALLGWGRVDPFRGSGGCELSSPGLSMFGGRVVRWWHVVRCCLAQLVDGPSSLPEELPTEEAQDAERQRLYGIIEELVKWESSTNEELLEAAPTHRRCDQRREHLTR